MPKSNRRPRRLRLSKRRRRTELFYVINSCVCVSKILVVGLYKILFHLKASVHELIFLILPSRPASPTLLQCYGTTIAHIRPPPRHPLRMPCTIQYWRWQYRVKTKSSAVSIKLACANSRADPRLKVPCAPRYFSSSFSYSTCTNDFGAVTHN